MSDTSRLVRMKIVNLGCIGPEGLTVELDKILCLVGPNNCGKSTVLRAYELAVGGKRLDPQDRCQRAGEQATSVEIWVHVPIGTPNIADDWVHTDGELRLVRSMWSWGTENKEPTRTTWNPKANEYSDDSKASGLDEVFSSRMPQPLRIGTLEGPDAEHALLLKLILEPLASRLEAMRTEEGSTLQAALAQVESVTDELVVAANAELESIRTDVNKHYQGVFPALSVEPKIGVDMAFKPMDALLKGSALSIREGEKAVRMGQQGTGSQRALFWSMLQVRSRLKMASDLVARRAEQIKKFEKIARDARKKAEEGSKPATRAKHETAAREAEEQLAALKAGGEIGGGGSAVEGLGLPGHMLLIDEPEIGLHPAAIRAAKTYLYGLAADAGWQVMLSTHAPAFIDPSEDHTTIVRLVRSEESPTPATYRASSAQFATDDKENLKLALRCDETIAEMFFGPHPVLVEGDTEFAAFAALMQLLPDEYQPARRPLLVRARGKDLLGLLIRVLSHFKVAFSVLHDADSPLRSDGKRNSAWTANQRIRELVDAARVQGLRVVHRVSIPDFEREHSLPEGTKDKPWGMWRAVKENVATRSSVRKVLDDLLASGGAGDSFSADFMSELAAKVAAWAAVHAPDDQRFSFTGTS